MTEHGRAAGRRRYRAEVLRWLCAVVVGGILSGFAFLLLTGRYLKDGPVVVAVTRAHGLHAGDFFVIGGWLVGLCGLALLAWQPRRIRPTR